MTVDGFLFARDEFPRTRSKTAAAARPTPASAAARPIQASPIPALPAAQETPTTPAFPEYVPGEPLLLTEREAAQALAVSPRKLWDLRVSGEIPCVRFGRSVRYDPADLQAWIARTKATA